MIESLQSLSRSPLPAITTIKLRSNRLQSLAGVERLLSLENLNIQDNVLTDPTEAARLTSLPNLRRLWLKNNPFTKTHLGYRVTIFNIFRNTPGYLEDIIIDDSGPGYSEKKQLVERVPEVERNPSQRSIRIVEDPFIVPDAAPETAFSPDKSELTKTSTRRRKPPRRRIVDLAQDDSPVRVASEPAVVTRASIDSRRSYRKSNERTATMPSVGAPVTSQLEQMTTEFQEPNEVGREQRDEYRARIEALRQQFGSNWLGALGEQGWHNEVQRAETMSQSPNLHRTNSLSSPIASGGRTLG